MSLRLRRSLRTKPPEHVDPFTRVSPHFILADFPERWRDIDYYGGKYQVSTLGRVRRAGKGRNSHLWYLLESFIDDHGRAKVSLRINGRCKQHTVSTLVAYAFLGSRPPDTDVCHDDGDATRNTLSNLYYGTKVQNMHDKLRHGTQPFGSASHFAKRTEGQVREVRARVQKGETVSSIARAMQVPRSWVSDVKNGVSWRHV